MQPFVVNATHLVPIDWCLIWDLPVSLQFCSCSSILDPRQVDSLMILVASFPLLGSFEVTRYFWFPRCWDWVFRLNTFCNNISSPVDDVLLTALLLG